MIIQAYNPIIEVHNLTVSYEKKPVLWSVDLSIAQGAFCCIVGPNGAGKSTLLKSMMGLLSPSAGYVKIFNKDIDESRKKIAYVPQRESVDWDFPTTVFDVVLMGRYSKIGLFKYPRKADKLIAQEALEKVEMQAYSQRQIANLSGGQQQRVFLARALAQEADIYFLDEPFSGVDAASEKTIIQLLKTLSSEGKTIISVHHDLQTVKNYFDWTILLNLKLIASGPTEKVFIPSLLEETYGGKLTVLSEMSNIIKQSGFNVREKH